MMIEGPGVATIALAAASVGFACSQQSYDQEEDRCCAADFTMTYHSVVEVHQIKPRIIISD